MKKYILAFLTAFMILTSSVINSFAQWEPDVRLTNNPWFSVVGTNVCSVSGNVIHTVWNDNRDGNYEIYYKRSTDSGINWSADLRLTNNSGVSYLPSLAVSGLFVHVVWVDDRDTNREIYYKRSTDGGVSWGADRRLTNNIENSFYPFVTAFGSNLHLVWYDLRDYSEQVYYKRSTDDGISWGTDIRLTYNTPYALSPSITFNGLNVHVVWDDYRNGNDEIYYKRSTDGGITWGADIRLTINSADSKVPHIAISGSNVHVVWEDNRDTNREIYYKRSTDGGVTWGADTRLSIDPAESWASSIAASDSNVHLVWEDNRNGNYEIYYKLTTDRGVSWGADTRLTNNAASSEFPSIAVYGLQINIVWSDDRDGNYEIYYKRNPTGIVGTQNIYTQVPFAYSLSQNCPNPFNPTTNFEFRIADFGLVNLTIYDAMGRTVETLQNGEMKPGVYKAEWNASGYPSGVYFYKLSTGSFTETKKMVLVK